MQYHPPPFFVLLPFLFFFFFSFYHFFSLSFFSSLLHVVHVVTIGACPKTITKTKIGRREAPLNLPTYSCCYNKLGWEQNWWGGGELLTLSSYWYIVVMNALVKMNTMGRWSFLTPFCCFWHILKERDGRKEIMMEI